MRPLYSFFFLLFYLSEICFAGAPPLVLEEGKKHYELGLHLDLLEDSRGILKIEDVAEKAFKKSHVKVFSNSVYWARIKIQNKTKAQKKWFLSQNYFTQDKVELFKKKKGKWRSLSVTPFKAREREYSFEMKPSQNSLYYIRVQGPLNRFHLELFSPEAFINKKNRETLVIGLFFGLVLSMILYNFIVFIFSRSLSHLYYILFVFFYGGHLLLTQGFLPPLFPKEIPFFNALTGLFFSLFSLHFLRPNRLKPKFLKGIQGLIWIWALLICVSFLLPYSLSLKLGLSASFGSLFYLYVCGIIRAKMSYRPALYYLGGLSFMFLGGGTYAGMINSVLGSSLVHALELIFFSMAIADQINLGQEVALRVSDGERQFQLNYAKRLEEEVAKRTFQLEMETTALHEFLENAYNKKKSSEQLLGSLSQGYLTFNSQGVIHEGATKITEKLLETNLYESEVNEVKIWDVLFKKDDQKDTFQKWLDKIFEGRFSFKDLAELAPKRFLGTEGTFIELEFRPIYEEDSLRKIVKVIMIASDKTNEVDLKQKLERDHENISFVTKCLENPLEFVDLIFDSKELLEHWQFERKSDKGELFRKFHTLKARFGQFGLKSLTALLNEIETELSNEEVEELDSKVKIFDDELKEFIKKNRLIVEAANKFLVDEGNAIQATDVIQKIFDVNSLEELHADIYKNFILINLQDKFKRYGALVDEVAKGQGKSIDCHFYGDKVMVEYNKFSDFVNVTIHLFRNMVDHGIETEEERIEKTKPHRGTIKVEFTNGGEDFSIKLSDDGGGIDPENIKEKILEKGLKKKEDLKDLSHSDIVNLIFLQNFSTKEEVTNVSGRGVGMIAVKEEVEKLGGEITVSSKIDEGTTYVIKLPTLS